MLLRKIGRRGSFLLFLGLLDVIYAYGLFRAEHAAARSQTQDAAARVLPLSVWAGLWLVVGLIVVFFAFRREDRVGFAAAVVIKVMWGVNMLIAWLLAGLHQGYLSATVWLSFALIAYLVSTWPEPARTHRGDTLP
jgi:hypothetical protein